MLVLLDDARADRLLRFHSPRAVIRATDAGEVAAALTAMEQAREAGHHLAGWFAYELGLLLEPRLASLLPPRLDGPLLCFGVFDRPDAMPAQAGLARMGPGRAYAGPLRPDWDAQAYAARFARVADWIGAGDIYQANLSFRARFAFSGDPLALYRELRGRAAAPYGAFVDDGQRQILSLSPELFFDLSADGRIVARPMKGTAGRDPDPLRDAAARAALAASAKDRAENLMIVDLIRNDLGRMARVGSVAVPELFAVETYPTVHQMVSTVTAQLPPNTAIGGILKALFPCGSITGAPKIRAMEIIAALEDAPRGAYCGAIGHFSPDGSARFNVAIRTLTIDGSAGTLGIGGAVVADSLAASEYEECLIKARYFTQGRRPLRLIETLRFAPDEGFVRLPLHLERMQRSAAALGLCFAPRRARAALDDAVATAAGPLRVRLTLNEEGCFGAAAAALAPSPPCWRYAISGARIHSADPLLRHKTDWRELYDGEYARRGDRCDEVLFCNERGELAEGSRSNIFLERDGLLWTPPLSSGALGGCLRRELIADGRCREAVLNPADLAEGRLFLGNSLRGLIAAKPAGALAL